MSKIGKFILFVLSVFCGALAYASTRSWAEAGAGVFIAFCFGYFAVAWYRQVQMFNKIVSYWADQADRHGRWPR